MLNFTDPLDSKISHIDLRTWSSLEMYSKKVKRKSVSKIGQISTA